MAVCNVEEVLLVFLLLVDDAVVDDTDVADGCLVDLTVRWIDCLLLLLAIEEEEVALFFVAAVVGVDIESLCIPSTAISLSLFFDLYCRVGLLDCLVVVVATISVDVMVLR